MKLFLDSASVVALKQWSSMGIVDGMTTNPSHLAHEGGDPLQRVRELCALLPHGEISVQVTESDPALVYRQAHEIASIAKNVVVKIPCHLPLYSTIEQLVQEDIPINVTLVFSVWQGTMMAKLGVRYISPFIGRLEDAGGDGIGLLMELRTMLNNYGFETQLLAASLRTMEHVEAAIAIAADAITVAPDLLEKMSVHALTDQGMERFATDWKKMGVRKFP